MLFVECAPRICLLIDAVSIWPSRQMYYANRFEIATYVQKSMRNTFLFLKTIEFFKMLLLVQLLVIHNIIAMQRCKHIALVPRLLLVPTSSRLGSISDRLIDSEFISEGVYPPFLKNLLTVSFEPRKSCLSGTDWGINNLLIVPTHSSILIDRHSRTD